MKSHDIKLFVGLFAGREINIFLANQTKNTKFYQLKEFLRGQSAPSVQNIKTYPCLNEPLLTQWLNTY